MTNVELLEEPGCVDCEVMSSPAFTRGTSEYRCVDGKPPACDRG